MAPVVNAPRLPDTATTAPQMNAPTPCDASKNDENVPTTDARSASPTPTSARSSRAGYISDIPAARTAVPTTNPATVGHAATTPIPTAASASAIDAETTNVSS